MIGFFLVTLNFSWRLLMIKIKHETFLELGHSFQSVKPINAISSI
jgi:hypothetical protein